MRVSNPPSVIWVPERLSFFNRQNAQSFSRSASVAWVSAKSTNSAGKTKSPPGPNPVGQITLPPNFTILSTAAHCRSHRPNFTPSQLHRRANSVTTMRSVRRLYWNHRSLGFDATGCGSATLMASCSSPSTADPLPPQASAQRLYRCAVLVVASNSLPHCFLARLHVPYLNRVVRSSRSHGSAIGAERNRKGRESVRMPVEYGDILGGG